MQFLADESCDFAAVRALRAQGHDVVAVVEITPRAADAAVLERASRESRILLTEDKDFGQLVYAATGSTAGVILLRFRARARRSLPQAVVRAVSDHGERLRGRFTVLSPGRIRFGKFADE